MSTGKGYLFRACSSKEITYYHLHVDKNSKAGRGIGKKLPDRKKGRLLVWPDWRLLV